MLRAQLLLVTALVVMATTHQQEPELDLSFLDSPEQLVERFKSTSTESNRNSYDSSLNCECVDKDLCKDGVIDTQGSAGIELKLTNVERNVYECMEPTGRVCCQIPFPTTQSTTQPTTQLTTSHSFHSTCGKRWTGVDLKIVSGQETSEAEFPWMVLLLETTNNTNLYTCGGSLIHPKVVMTAAHCIKHLEASRYKIRVGEYVTNSYVEITRHQDRGVAEILIPGNYDNRNFYNDIALLVLVDAVNPDKNVGTICLPDHDDDYERETNCVATGWGKDGLSNDSKYQSILQKSLFDMVPLADCERALRNSRLGKYFILNGSFNCAKGKAGMDTCKGDGGGPLFCQKKGLGEEQFVEVGITAWGVGCGGDFPGVYSNVAFNRPWINLEMSKRGLKINTGFY